MKGAIGLTRDAAVLDLLKGNNALLDSRLLAVLVGRDADGAVNVELQFRARPDSDFAEIRLRFTEIVEYEISYEEKEEYIDIWDLKFIKLDDGTFYITLDPDPSTLPAAGVTILDASDTDHFFIRARHVETFTTNADRPQSA